MKQHNIKLNENQINEIINALSYDYNEDFGANDPKNQMINRIIKKLEKAIAE